MMTTKLTLSVDDRVVKRAKRFAARERTSVSALVERYLDLVSRPRRQGTTPVLDRLRGVLAGADLTVDDYRRHLDHKHR